MRSKPQPQFHPNFIISSSSSSIALHHPTTKWIGVIAQSFWHEINVKMLKHLELVFLLWCSPQIIGFWCMQHFCFLSFNKHLFLLFLTLFLCSATHLGIWFYSFILYECWVLSNIFLFNCFAIFLKKFFLRTYMHVQWKYIYINLRIYRQKWKISVYLCS